MLPSIFGENLFEDWFGFPSSPELRDAEKKLYGKRVSREMKTDIHEHDDHYEVDIDLPGFRKEEIALDLENGYMTVSASKDLDKDETDRKGRVIRQERYAGSLQRSFFVGEEITAEDISAKFENGVLSVNIPKKEVRKLPEKKTISIDG